MSDIEDKKVEANAKPKKEPTQKDPKQNEPTQKTQTAQNEEEDDLDDLLDEFDEMVLSKPPGGASSQTKGAVDDSQATSTTKKPSEANQEDDFQINMEELIKDLNIEDPKAKDEFEHLVKQFEKTHRADAKKAMDPQNFDSVMKDTMERLKKSGETIDEQLKNDPSSSNPEDMLTQLLAGLGGGSADGDFDMSKLLTDMLEQLSSKDVLYEPIKDLNTKFPDFLKEQKDKLPSEEHTRYTKQYEVTNDIMALFESPEFDNDNTEKREEVNKLLEKLQEFGNPPKELVGDVNDFPGLGDLGALGGGGDGLDFDSKDLPKDLEKELEEGCKQQ